MTASTNAYQAMLQRLNAEHARRIRHDRIWRVVAAAVVIALSIIMLSACRSAPTCPVVVPPPPVTIKTPPLPCSLPPLPEKLTLTPVAIDASRMTLDQHDIAAIGVYLLAVRNWVAAAQACLTVAP